MGETIKVLLAEDEVALAQIIKESLETRGFEVSLALNGQRALELYESLMPDVLVLDVMMPKRDGFDVAKTIRQTNPTIPIIFLTAKSQTRDVVEGFSVGGNDYLKKPFSIEELIVRIKNLLGRSVQVDGTEPLNFSGFQFDQKKQTLQYRAGEVLHLTHREAQILFYLVVNQNEVMDRTIILKKIWGENDFFNARSMDVFVSKLRKKLSANTDVKILNVRGKGYKLVT